MAIRVAANTCYVELAANPKLALTQFTVCGWFYIEDIASYRALWGLGDTGGDYLFALTDHGHSDKLSLSWFDSGSAGYRGMTANTYAPPQNRWFWHAVMVDFSGGLQTSSFADHFVDGFFTPSTPDTSNAVAQTSQASPKFRVLSDHDGDSGRGSACFVRFFNTKLSLPDLQSNMLAQRCPPALRGGCLIDFPFHAGDLTNHGTLGGVATATGTVTDSASVVLPSASAPRRPWLVLPSAPVSSPHRRPHRPKAFARGVSG